MTTAKILLFIVVFALTGCDKNASASDTRAANPPAATAPADSPAQGESAGTKHEPPIALDKVPDGHWYCDMGTSHYSRPDEGDGKCPLCGMKLKHMDHAAMGHDHGEHGHGASNGHHDGDGHHHE